MKSHKKSFVPCFINDIWIALPFHRKAEIRFIKEIEESAHSYINFNPEATKEDLILHFGEPSEIVNDYFNSLEPQSYLGSIKRSTYLKLASGAIIVSVCAILFSFLVFEHKAYSEWEKTQAVGEQITIEYIHYGE